MDLYVYRPKSVAAGCVCDNSAAEAEYAAVLVLFK